MEKEHHCTECGGLLNNNGFICSECGAIQSSFVYKSRIAAAVLAMTFGIFGGHRFYLGQKRGIFYLLFFWTYIPWLIGIIEGIAFLSTDQEKWNDKYNHGIFAGSEKGGAIAIIAILPIIAIIGILAAVALPAYQDYTIRAKLAEVILTSSEAKNAVSEYVLIQERWPENNGVLGIPQSHSSNLVNSIKIGDGIIYVELSGNVGVTGTFVLTPTYQDSGLLWSCSSPNISTQYLPSSCTQ